MSRVHRHQLQLMHVDDVGAPFALQEGASVAVDHEPGSAGGDSAKGGAKIPTRSNVTVISTGEICLHHE